jgi:hypothetical protein
MPSNFAFIMIGSYAIRMSIPMRGTCRRKAAKVT